LLLWLVEVISWFALRQAHRGKFWAFEFGIGKIERIITILIALGLIISAVYAALTALGRLRSPEVLPTPALVLAVAAAAINLTQNLYCTVDFSRSHLGAQASQGARSLIIESQLRSRVAKTLASVVVLVVLLIATWLTDPMATAYVDVLGALFVSGYMLHAAVQLIRESLPDLLDRALPERDQLIVMGVVARYFDDFEHFGALRSRKSGGQSFVEIELGFASDLSLGEVSQRCAAIERDISARLSDAVVTVVPRPRAGNGTGM
jgi:cation diffusion facilitator family transporter